MAPNESHGATILREAVKAELGKLKTVVAKKLWRDKSIGSAQWPYLDFDTRLAVLKLSGVVPRKNAIISNEAISHLARDRNVEVRKEVASNQDMPANILALLVEDNDSEVRCCIAKNKSTNSEILEKLFLNEKYRNDASFYVICAIANNPSTPQSILEKTAIISNPNIRSNTAKNTSSSSEILEKLSRSRDDYIRYGVAENPSTPSHILVKLAASKTIYVRNAVAKNPSTPIDILERFSRDTTEHKTVGIGFLNFEVHIRAAVAENRSTPPNILHRLTTDIDADVRHAVAKNPSTQIQDLRRLVDDEDQHVSLAAICNRNVHWSERMLLLKKIDAEPDNILADAIDADHSAYLKIQVWWFTLLKIAKAFNSNEYKLLKKSENDFPEFRLMYEREMVTLRQNPILSLIAKCLGCNIEDDVLEVRPSRRPPLATICQLPEALQRLWLSDPIPRKKRNHNNSFSIKNLRSAEVKLQLNRARSLQKKIINELLTLLPEAQSLGRTNSVDSMLLRHIELSAESFDVQFVNVHPDKVDRTSSMLSGPFFTSENYPAPKSMYPLVQIDLRIASSIIGQPLGDGLLQLWYSTFEFIRVIPRPEVDLADETSFSIDLLADSDDNDFDNNHNLPLPFSWDSYLNGNPVKVFSTCESNGLVSQGDYASIYMDKIEDSGSNIKKLRVMVEKYESLTSDNCSSLVHLFGTFYPIQYSSAEVGKRCLFAIKNWGSDGNAQVFYEIDAAGSVAFQFRESLR